jgi:integrase
VVTPTPSKLPYPFLTIRKSQLLRVVASFESLAPTSRVALTAAEQASPLARRPYDLRHACLSTWLNGGVYPTQVAEWAGHGVDVLLRIYAKCLVGQDELAKRRISEALRQD